MASPREDVEFLARSEHRVAVLDVLADGPRRRADLRAETGASDPTVGRILGDFEDRGWVGRQGHEYALTQPGAFVAERFGRLLDQLSTEQKLRAVWRWLPGELDGFTVDLVADARVTAVEPGDPYGPANHCGRLFREAEWLRGFDAGLTAPHHFAELYQRIVDGMTTEVVLPSDVLERIQTAYPEESARVGRSEHFTLWVNDDLPLYRLTVFHDRVGIGGYDPDSGVMQVYLETESPDAREWAEATFERYRRASHPPPRREPVQ
ncbi:MAG TPA: MarR family transcriptional regulator [Halobacteriales archaeon]|nr:MarR family transcriptional regulator [Halobacteriales archaeon]